MEEKMMEDNYGRNLKSEVKGKGGKKYYQILLECGLEEWVTKRAVKKYVKATFVIVLVYNNC